MEFELLGLLLLVSREVSCLTGADIGLPYFFSQANDYIGY